LDLGGLTGEFTITTPKTNFLNYLQVLKSDRNICLRISPQTRKLCQETINVQELGKGEQKKSFKAIKEKMFFLALGHFVKQFKA
jgi:hypothetical protein